MRHHVDLETYTVEGRSWHVARCTCGRHFSSTCYVDVLDWAGYHREHEVVGPC